MDTVRGSVRQLVAIIGRMQLGIWKRGLEVWILGELKGGRIQELGSISQGIGNMAFMILIQGIDKRNRSKNAF